MNECCIDPRAEDWDIKAKLLHKYGGCFSSLSQELKKKKKSGKLPKEARVQLQEWWSRNYTWPYPSVCYSLPYIHCIYVLEHVQIQIIHLYSIAFYVHLLSCTLIDRF